MFGLFKKKSKREVLIEKYKELMKESHQLSTTNRTLSDQKYAEAQKLMDEADALAKEEKGQ